MYEEGGGMERWWWWGARWCRMRVKMERGRREEKKVIPSVFECYSQRKESVKDSDCLCLSFKSLWQMSMEKKGTDCRLKWIGISDEGWKRRKGWGWSVSLGKRRRSEKVHRKKGRNQFSNSLIHVLPFFDGGRKKRNTSEGKQRIVMKGRRERKCWWLMVQIKVRPDEGGGQKGRQNFSLTHSSSLLSHSVSLSFLSISLTREEEKEGKKKGNNRYTERPLTFTGSGHR